jgi:hypothetical protein
MLGGQAKIEADNLGFELLYEGARFGIERSTGRSGYRSFGIQSKLEIIGLKQRPPC